MENFLIPTLALWGLTALVVEPLAQASFRRIFPLTLGRIILITAYRQCVCGIAWGFDVLPTSPAAPHRAR